MIGAEHLDLPVDCTLQVDLTNPLLSDRGSMSPALTIPQTARNQRLLGYPSRIDAAERHDVYDGTLADGSYIRECKVNVVGAGPDGIDISIGTDESVMYQQWADVKLRDIPGLPVYRPDGGTSYLVSLMGQVYHRAVDLDYHCFPVAVEFDGNSSDEVANALPLATILNRVHSDSSAKISGDLVGTTLDSAARTIAAGMGSEDTVDVPLGYGITPFLRVGRALHILFDCYGYELQECIFDTDPQLSHLVLLNNTADAICAGYLDYRDMMPDCTINDLLDALKAHFGAVFYVDSSSMTARCVLVRDTMVAAADADWTLKQSARPSIEMTPPQRLVLMSGAGYEGTETQCDAMPEFLDTFGRYVDTNLDGDAVRGRCLLPHDAFTQTIYKMVDGSTDRKVFSSLYWPWDSGEDGYEPVQVTGPDQLVPLYSLQHAPETFSDDALNLTALPLYLSGVRNAHTAIKGSSGIATDDTVNQSTDLAFCFAAGNYVTAMDESYGLFFGTPYNRDIVGRRLVYSGNTWMYSLLYVGEDGAYNRFWKEYDAMLRFGNRGVKVEMRMSRADIAALDMSVPKMIHGQRLLPEGVSHPMPMDSAFSCSVALRSMKALDDEEYAPTLFLAKPIGYWLFSSNLEEKRAALWASAKAAIEASYNNVTYITRDFAPEAHSVPSDLEMPTAADVTAGKTHEVTYSLRLTVHFQGFANGTGHLVTQTFASDEVTDTLTATAYD